MFVRVGYDIVLAHLRPTPMVAMLDLHPPQRARRFAKGTRRWIHVTG
jgi:hypothetical protein